MSRRRDSTKAQLVWSTTALRCSSMVQWCIIWAHRVQLSYREFKHNFDLHIVRVVRIMTHWQVTYFQKLISSELISFAFRCYSTGIFKLFSAIRKTWNCLSLPNHFLVFIFVSNLTSESWDWPLRRHPAGFGGGHQTHTSLWWPCSKPRQDGWAGGSQPLLRARGRSHAACTTGK